MGCFISFIGYNFLAQEMEGFLKAMQSTFCPVGLLSYNLQCRLRSGYFNEHFLRKKVE